MRAYVPIELNDDEIYEKLCEYMERNEGTEFNEYDMQDVVTEYVQEKYKDNEEAIDSIRIEWDDVKYITDEFQIKYHGYTEY